MAKASDRNRGDIKAAIATNLSSLINRLGEAVAVLTEAEASLSMGDQKGAIGSILCIDGELRDATVLYQAILVLHRQR